MSRKLFKLAACFGLLALFTSGCAIKDLPLIGKLFPGAPPAVQPATSTEPTAGVSEQIAEKLSGKSPIKKFSNLSELKDFLARSQSAGAATFGTGMMRSLAAPMAAEKSIALGDSAVGSANGNSVQVSQEIGGGGAKPDYSKTNTQVEGVDEADIIKTDGKNIYLVSGSILYIVSAQPAESMEILSKIDLKSVPQDIYLDGDRLAVFGADYNFQPLAAGGSEPASGTSGGSVSGSEPGGAGISSKTVGRMMPIRRQAEATFFKVYDLTDPKNPVLSRDLAFDGSYTNSRLIGDHVYFLTSTYSYNYDNFMMPLIYSKGTALPEENPAVYYFDLPYNSQNFVRVSSINLKNADEAPATETYLLESAQNIFMSANNLYITYTKYVSEEELVMAVAKDLMLSRLPSEDQAKIAKIEATDDYILTLSEKLYKINSIIERYVRTLPPEGQAQTAKDLEAAIKQKYQDISKELEKTVIHKIAVADGKLEYKGEGEVTGSVLNQFSMDESDGYFRIATTKNQSWSNFAPEGDNLSYNNVYVLDGGLKTVGRLENLAKGERIYSARFMGKRAYLVTFKQTDPLFTIDLSDPANPKVLGELKIPGFSNYLHPYDENTLIGLGHDTEENQWGGTVTAGLKVALFDVADVGAPKVLDEYLIGGRGSDSEALNDHHAFLFSKEKNLLVIPATIREGGKGFDWGKFVFSGALVFDLSDKKFNLKGKIDHSDGGRAGVSEDWYGYNFYDNTVRRSLYINDALYTFSSKYLKANKLADLSESKKLQLATTPEIIPMPVPTPMPLIEPEQAPAPAKVEPQTDAAPNEPG
jgi:uncharacterized secreted protein with C-terminal beta-propeller domain